MVELKPITADVALFHILSRLPVKSLFRFSCVSKQWHSFITKTPMFPKMHLHHVINDHHQNHHKILFLPDSRPWVFRTIDCETPKDGFTATRPFPFTLGPDQKVSIATSLHGMVCVIVTKPGMLFHNSDIILWNPVTGDYKTLSKTGSHEDCYKISGDEFGMYYSSSEDDYKLVCVTRHPIANIYSLKSDSWKNIEPNFLLNENPSFQHRLHELEQLLASKSYSSMTFDTKTEKLTPPLENERTDCMGFVSVKGRIYFCVAIVNSKGVYDTIELWRGKMDGYTEWKKVVSSFPKQEHACLGILHVMRNGNRLMHSISGECVYVLDTKNNTKDTMCSVNVAFQPVGKYMETIVSPNQYMM